MIDFVKLLNTLNLENKKITMLKAGFSKNLDLAIRNLRNIYLVDAGKVSTYDLIDCELLVIDQESIKVLTSILKV